MFMIKRCSWKIEYEIPPLRAIYFAEVDNCTESEAREMVYTEHPNWRIRKITKAIQGSQIT